MDHASASRTVGLIVELLSPQWILLSKGAD
jgi:hypothetical protein